MHIRTILRTVAFLALSVASTTAMAQEVIRLRIASGHPPANTYVNLMQNFFVPEVTKRVAEKTKYKVEFVEGYGGAMVKVADTLEGVQAGIIDIGGYCFCFEPSNLPLHAFQVMLPFGTMDPTVSLKVARAVYDKVPYMSKVFEDKFKQKLIALIADNGYNLGTNFEWNSIADIKGQKIAGAGLNLKWLEFAGATPVQSSLPDAYTSMQTGVYNGWIMFPSARGFECAERSIQISLAFSHAAEIHTIVGFFAGVLVPFRLRQAALEPLLRRLPIAFCDRDLATGAKQILERHPQDPLFREGQSADVDSEGGYFEIEHGSHGLNHSLGQLDSFFGQAEPSRPEGPNAPAHSLTRVGRPAIGEKSFLITYVPSRLNARLLLPSRSML